MSDIVWRLEDLRIFIRDNSYDSSSSMRLCVELFSQELLQDIDDAVYEIERQRAVIEAARKECREIISEMEGSGQADAAMVILRTLDGGGDE